MEKVKSLYEVFTGFLNNMLEVLPSFLIAVSVLVVFVVISRVSKKWVGRATSKVWDEESLQRLATTLTSATIVVIGVLVAATILFPGLEAGDLIGVLGLSSIAIGFAFKDIIQNFVAGVLILSRRPFRIGDQITTNDYDGTVKEITFRSTELETYDHERVIVPNAKVFTNPVVVHTAYAKRRSTFRAHVAYGADLEEARRVILEAASSCEVVESDPPPKVRCMSHDSSSVVFDVLFWTKAERGSTQDGVDQVCTAVKLALDDADIQIPFPQRTLHLATGALDESGHLPLSVHEEPREEKTNGSRGGRSRELAG